MSEYTRAFSKRVGVDESLSKTRDSFHWSEELTKLVPRMALPEMVALKYRWEMEGSAALKS